MIYVCKLFIQISLSIHISLQDKLCRKGVNDTFSVFGAYPARLQDLMRGNGRETFIVKIDRNIAKCVDDASKLRYLFHLFAGSAIHIEGLADHDELCTDLLCFFYDLFCRLFEVIPLDVSHANGIKTERIGICKTRSCFSVVNTEYFLCHLDTSYRKRSIPCS